MADGQTPSRETSNIFARLMQDIWEGGETMDTELAGTKFANALDMFKRFFPEEFEKKQKVASEHGDYFLVTFPDNSSLVIYESGDGLEEI